MPVLNAIRCSLPGSRRADAMFMGPAWSEARLIELGDAFEQLTHARKPPQFLPTVTLAP